MSGSSDILAAIARDKQREVADIRASSKQGEFERRIAQSPPARGFEARIRSRIAKGGPAVIAESKKASPSKGVMREDYQVSSIAQSYEAGGATCISVLTDARHFHGSMSDLHAARQACALPILRKDFIVDPIQVYETRANGADCLLLIVSMLQRSQLHDLAALADELGLDVLIETHSRPELELALELPSGMIGINNRNLHTFETSIETSLQLVRDIPQGRVVVSESGIRAREDVERLAAAGISCFLVGEAFMRSADPGAMLQGLFAASPDISGSRMRGEALLQ